MNKKKSKNIKAREKINQRTPWLYLVIVGIVLVSYFFLRGNYGFIRYMQLQKQKKYLAQQIEQLEKQQTELEMEIDRLLHNYRYIEKIVREKYKMGKDKEKIYFMISPTDKEKEL